MAAPAEIIKHILDPDLRTRLEQAINERRQLEPEQLISYCSEEVNKWRWQHIGLLVITLGIYALYYAVKNAKKENQNIFKVLFHLPTKGKLSNVGIAAAQEVKDTIYLEGNMGNLEIKDYECLQALKEKLAKDDINLVRLKNVESDKVQRPMMLLHLYVRSSRGTPDKRLFHGWADQHHETSGGNTVWLMVREHGLTRVPDEYMSKSGVCMYSNNPLQGVVRIGFFARGWVAEEREIDKAAEDVERLLDHMKKVYG